jgi:hypothetical protein
MPWIVPVRNPMRVASLARACGHGPGEPDESRSKLWGAARRPSRSVRGVEAAGKACGRRRGEIFAKAFVSVPWKGETQGSIQQSAC